MRSLFGSPRLLAVGFGCLLAAMPAYAQTCPGKTSSLAAQVSSSTATQNQGASVQAGGRR